MDAGEASPSCVRQESKPQGWDYSGLRAGDHRIRGGPYPLGPVRIPVPGDLPGSTAASDRHHAASFLLEEELTSETFLHTPYFCSS